jgi:hypothetical protein
MGNNCRHDGVGRFVLAHVLKAEGHRNRRDRRSMKSLVHRVIALVCAEKKNTKQSSGTDAADIPDTYLE